MSVHRQVMRYGRTLLLAGLLVLIGIQATVASSTQPDRKSTPVPPEPVGDVITIQSDSGSLTDSGTLGSWELSAYNSTKGLCVRMETSEGAGEACGQEFAALGVSALADGEQVTVYGPVSKGVATVEVISNGTTLGSSSVAPPSSAFSVGFYAVSVPATPKITHVRALDANGNEIESVTL